MRFFMSENVEVEALENQHTLLKIRIPNHLVSDFIDLLDNLFHAARWIKIRTRKPTINELFPDKGGLRVP